MKNNSQSKIARPLSLAVLLLIYFLLCSQYILKQVSNTEASNCLDFFQLSPNGQAQTGSRYNFFPQNIYFGSLSFWTQIFGATLTSVRSFSVFCGAGIILVLFFILRNKLDTKNMFSLISICVLNPLFIYFATNFDPIMELLLGLFILYSIILLFYRLKLKELISFRHRRHIINWRSIILSNTLPSRAKTIFSFISAIFAIILIVITLLIGLKQDVAIRKVFTAIYQSSHNKQFETSQSNREEQPEASVPIVYFMQNHSSSIYVENLLVAKELNKTPLNLGWQADLDKTISLDKLPVNFWVVSSKDQPMDNIQNIFPDQNLSNSELDKKKPITFRETDSFRIDDFSAKYFNSTKGIL